MQVELPFKVKMKTKLHSLCLLYLHGIELLEVLTISGWFIVSDIFRQA